MTAIVGTIFPSFAGAHASPGLGQGDTPRDPQAAAELREVQQSALESLPAETAAGTCRATELVVGLGPACRTQDDQFRVVLESGATMETHGGDAPAADAQNLDASHLPATAAALDGASRTDIHCIEGAGDRRIELVYAYPSNRANRFATVAPLMQQSLYEASAFVDAESRARDARAGRRIPTACDVAGVPIVTVVQLDAVGSGGAEFADVVSQLNARGYPVSTANSTSPRRFMVFYDATNAMGAAGVGQFYKDDSPTADNHNNMGARYAMEFAWSTNREPHWDVFLHEMSHNMGAVSDNAPDSSRAGHCVDGLDIMCYKDAAATDYNASVCAQERFDCGGDTYFNPAPAPGSWLATHWNLGSTTNAWLRPWDAGWNDGGVPDNDAPTVPAGASMSAAGHNSINLSWGASSDARSAVTYVIRLDRFSGGSWVLDSTADQMGATTLLVGGLVSGGVYRVNVAARDGAGNLSGEVSATGGTASGAPWSPASVAATLEAGLALAVSWPAGSASTAVAGYDIELQNAAGVTLSKTTRTAGRALRYTGLGSGQIYRARVRTVAQDGQLGPWQLSPEIATGGVLAGAGGGVDAPIVSFPARTMTSFTAQWAGGANATTFLVSLLADNGSTIVAVPQTSATALSFINLKPGTGYKVRVVAVSAAGNTSPVTIVATRTLADTAKPGTVKVSGKAKGGKAWRITWGAARDNVGVVRYEIERQNGKKWKRLGAATAAKREYTVAGVKKGAKLTLRVRAVDAAGNAGAWTTHVKRR